MAWGGFVDKKSSKYLKEVVIAEKTLKYLESLKKNLNISDKLTLEKTIQIICSHIETLSKEKNKQKRDS